MPARKTPPSMITPARPAASAFMESLRRDTYIHANGTKKNTERLENWYRRDVLRTPVEPANSTMIIDRLRIPEKTRAASYQRDARNAFQPKAISSGKASSAGPISTRATTSIPGLINDRTPRWDETISGGQINRKPTV